MTVTTSLPSSPSPSDIWSWEYLVDNIINNLMNSGNGYNGNKIINKYIFQSVDKFQSIRIKSPDVKFYIYAKDFKEDTKKYLEIHVKDCKTKDDAYKKLDGIFTEVIAFIYKEATPLILSTVMDEDQVWVKRSINEIRTSISEKWEIV